MNFSLTKISLKKIMIQGWIWVLICNTPNLAADSNGCLPPIGSNIQASCEAPKQGPQGIRGPQGPKALAALQALRQVLGLPQAQIYLMPPGSL